MLHDFAREPTLIARFVAFGERLCVCQRCILMRRAFKPVVRPTQNTVTTNVPVPEVRTMVDAAKQFVAGEIHFSALEQPITNCEWWARVNDADSAIHRLPIFFAKTSPITHFESAGRMESRSWTDEGVYLTEFPIRNRAPVI